MPKLRRRDRLTLMSESPLRRMLRHFMIILPEWAVSYAIR
jgi:hypothetical protein